MFRINDSNRFKVYAGSSQLAQLQVFLPDRIIVHPDYNLSTRIHDIALVHVATPFPLVSADGNIRAICLPSTLMQPLYNKQIRVIGWGYTNYKQPLASSQLQEVDLDLIPLSQCRAKYAKIKQPIFQTQLCSWDADKDACTVRPHHSSNQVCSHFLLQGDSGGPMLQYSAPGQAILFGVVSFGVTCADQFPGVFTSVSYYLHWIYGHTKE